MSVVNGTSDADGLWGTDGNDELYGMESDDLLFATAGSDVLDGGEGFDTANYFAMGSGISVESGAGATSVSGPDGKVDTLLSVEKVFGTYHNDTFSASVAGVTLEGSGGDDVYIVDAEGVTIIEESGLGYDELRTSLNTIKMDPFLEKLTFTGTGDFKAYGNASDNEIIGGAGNDWLWGGAGADHFVGGDGFDTVSYSDSLEGVRVSDWFNDGLTIAYGDTFTSIEAIEGSKFDDQIHRYEGSMVIDGSDGFDTVSYFNFSGAVNIEIGNGVSAVGDTLLNVEKVIGSGLGDHFTANIGGVTFAGEWGDDVYTINSAGVTIEEVEGYMGGTDQVYTNLSVMHLGAFVENLTYTGTGDFTGYGNDTWNRIVGGSGNDVLYGGGNGDSFDGGDGIDVLSYGDSKVAMTLDWANREFSGIAEGDTYQNIEIIRGSDFNDTFYANGMAWDFALDGAKGQDLLSFKYAFMPMTIDLSGAAYKPWDPVPELTGIELIEGSQYFDHFIGSAGNDTFIGGGGGDVVDGRDGHDSVWYLTSAAAVEVNLQTGIYLGGDAQDDQLTNIEGVMGSHFNDTLIGNEVDNYLEGGRGSDLINGGDGNDTLYGGLVSDIGPFSLEGVADDAQADQLYGGFGDDVIVSAENDLGTQAFGEAGNDTLTVVNGVAHGGAGDDVLTGKGGTYSLFGGEGEDRLILNLVGQQATGGFADGGEGDDAYLVNTSGLVTIKDGGSSLNDTLILNTIANASQLNVTRVGDDVYLHSANDGSTGVPDNGVKLAGWYAGFNTIEHLQTADGQTYDLPMSGDAFAMFG
ncbi:calcium-binding protein [Pseudomonas sp. TNT2022 ID233]|uniref:calcium-binding protein n=1 Tax=Pseudomonas aphyarum TaxID=2942629 RepID=UPI0023622EBC|nr:calcium-binding protein [Pseudomonas aphyarum]MDD1138381.1 calcium-binding protein [Pseudomonas aphyarum]